MRLRQVALVARDLEPEVESLCEVLGIDVAFRDPGIATFGLHNAIMPIGDTFLEVVSPQREGTTAGRLLERRHGDGGYMVIVQCEDLEAARKRMADLDVRVVWEASFPDIATLHLHPRDVGAAILSLDWADPPGSWRWAGPDWQNRPPSERSSAIVGVEVQGEDPEALSARWSRALDRPCVPDNDGAPAIPLDDGRIRFRRAEDGRGPGVAGLSVRIRDREAALAAARRRGAAVASDEQTVTLCGAHIRLVQE